MLLSRGKKAEKSELVFAHMRVDQQRYLAVQRRESGKRRQRDRCLVTDTAHVNEHLVRALLDQSAAEESNHVERLFPTRKGVSIHVEVLRESMRLSIHDSRCARCAKIAARMQKANDILGRAMRRMAKPEAVQAWLNAAWPGIVGAKLAAHTRPLRCAGGLLEIATSSKEWLHQLDCMKEDFRSKINDSWGTSLIREVRFVPERPGPNRIRHEHDNDYTPFVRAKKRG